MTITIQQERYSLFVRLILFKFIVDLLLKYAHKRYGYKQVCYIVAEVKLPLHEIDTYQHISLFKIIWQRFIFY